MIPEQQTAHRGQPAGGGSKFQNLAVPFCTIGSAFPQSVILSTHEIEVAKLRAQTAEISYQVETGLATIHNARKTSRACLSAHGRLHWNSVAIDEGNRLSDLLQIENPPTIKPTRPGRRIPPSEATIRRALKCHQEIIAAKIEAIEAEAALFAAWRQPCGTPEWCAWEAAWRANSRALSKIDKLSRGAL